MKIELSSRGNFSKLQKFLNAMAGKAYLNALDQAGAKGTQALASATPTDSGLTAASWTHAVETGGGGVTIVWSNTNVNDGVNIAIILQYGHGTGTGGYVAGRDYINPAIEPIFKEIADEVWKVVTSS